MAAAIYCTVDQQTTVNTKFHFAAILHFALNSLCSVHARSDRSDEGASAGSVTVVISPADITYVTMSASIRPSSLVYSAFSYQMHASFCGWILSFDTFDERQRISTF